MAASTRAPRPRLKPLKTHVLGAAAPPRGPGAQLALRSHWGSHLPPMCGFPDENWPLTARSRPPSRPLRCLARRVRAGKPPGRRALRRAALAPTVIALITRNKWIT